MSLSYDLTGIEDFKNRCYEGEGDNLRLSQGTEWLIWKTMTIGMGAITKENWMEFAARAALANFVWPSGMTRGEVEELVKEHIGLKTNVGPKRTRSKFMKVLDEELSRVLYVKEQMAERESA